MIDELDEARALGGKFIPLLRAAYNERAVAEIATRVRGTLPLREVLETYLVNHLEEHVTQLTSLPVSD